MAAETETNSAKIQDFEALLEKIERTRPFLNKNNVLSKSILRFYEITSVSEDLCPLNSTTSILKALTIRHSDMKFKRLSSKVFPQIGDGLIGCSCQIKPANFSQGSSKYMNHTLQEYYEISTVTDYLEKIANLRKLERKQTFVGAIELSAGENIPYDDWIVDEDGETHVTIAVHRASGIEAVEVTVETLRIPELNALNWRALPYLFVYLRGGAVWRDDYFPDEAGWTDCVLTFNMILEDGGLEEYFNTWRLHQMLHSEKYSLASEISESDMEVPLALGLSIIDSYLDSDECDPNNDYTVQLHALDFLKSKIADLRGGRGRRGR